MRRSAVVRFTLALLLIGLSAFHAHGEYGPNGEGRLLWHYKSAGSDCFDWCQPAIIYNKETGQRIIIFGDGDEVGGGQLYAVDADTRKNVWEPVSFEGPLGNSPATLSADGERVYFGEGSKPGKVYCVDTSAGHLVWTATGMPSDAGAFMSCGALSHDERTFYIGSGAWPEDKSLADNRLYAIDTATGRMRWVFKSETHPSEGESGASNYGSFFCDPAVLADGRIVAATFSGHVYCIKDRGDRAEQVWDFELIDKNATGYASREPFHQEVWGSPAIDSDGTIYIGSNAGKVHAIDPDTGTLKWETESTGGEVFGAPVIGADGNIYAGAESHYLYVWHPPAERASTPVPPIARYFWKDRWPNGGTALANGEVVFGGEQGNRYVSVKLVDGKLVKQWESDPVGEPDETEAKTEPLIDPVTHTIYVSGGHSGGLFALKGTQPLADSPWPKVQRDIRNSGQAEVAFKRYLFTCDLVDETEAVEGFKKTLEQDEWKSVCTTFMESGARDLEIYVFQDRVLAILETTVDFELERLETELGMSDAYSGWEARARRFLKPVPEADGERLCTLLDRVYKLGQKKEHRKEEGYVQEPLKLPTRRVVEARELVDDPAEIARYKSLHAMGKAWPEITQGLKDIGIVDNEIYSVGNRTFEFYEVTKEFDWEKSWEALESKPVSQKWGALVGPIDRPFTDKDGKPLANQIMKRIFKLGK